MADKRILIDTSILIDHFRKSNKSNSKLVALYDKGYEFCISVVTKFEIYSGTPDSQIEYWRELLGGITILNFDSEASEQAVTIYQKLKLISKQIDTADLFIAAIALSNNLPIATLNKKHFVRVDDLIVID
ncbi:MAG: type II toxin-antitoxin system VapC family toxin [Bacteroidota bacterium]